MVSALLIGGESSREANRKGRARCGVPGAVCDRTWEDNAQRPWSHDPKEQPLLPGPGNNDNKALGRVQKTPRRSAERRGVGSLRRRALASKVRARVRS